MKEYSYEATQDGALTLTNNDVSFKLLNGIGHGIFKIYIYDTFKEFIKDQSDRFEQWRTIKISICLGKGWCVKLKHARIALNSEYVEVYQYKQDFLFLLNKDKKRD